MQAGWDSSGRLPAHFQAPRTNRLSGEVRTVKFVAAESIPAPLAICLRERLAHWRFDDVHLSSDIQLFATFALR